MHGKEAAIARKGGCVFCFIINIHIFTDTLFGNISAVGHPEIILLKLTYIIDFVVTIETAD